MSQRVVVLVVLFVFAGCMDRANPRRATVSKQEPVVGLPCDGCELVFEDLPQELAATATVAPAGTAGEPMRIFGVVTDQNGKPVRGTIVYVYQTDANGVYPPSKNRHGAYRGWARTDHGGHYRFDTVRPGSYPTPGAPPQHVHMHIIEPGRCTYYIASLEFTDDPLLMGLSDPRTTPRGSSGIVTPTREHGVWLAKRDIVLGKNIPNHTACSQH